MAGQVMRMSSSTVAQRTRGSWEDNESQCAVKDIRLAREAEGGQAASKALPIVRDVIRSGGGRPLDASPRAFFEPRLGCDLGRVRIHTDTRAAEASQEVNASAFTLGRNIYFGRGEYQPQSTEGQRLLAHELAHVLQQSSVAQADAVVQRTVVAASVDCHPPAAADIPVVGANPLGRLRTADTRAIELLTTAHDSLEYSRTRILAGELPAWPTVSDRVAEGLQRILRMNPEDPAIWTGIGPGSVFVLMRRLEIVRDLLRSGMIQYHCRSSRAGGCGFGCLGCDGGPCCTGNFACSCDGIFHSFLCDEFWGQGAAGRTYTVMHEPFHISFDFIGDAGRLANAHCYSRLAFWINGEDAPGDRRAQCPLAA